MRHIRERRSPVRGAARRARLLEFHDRPCRERRRARRRGARKVASVDRGLAQTGHLKRDLPVLLEARAIHQLRDRLAFCRRRGRPVVAAMADYALSCLELKSVRVFLQSGQVVLGLACSET